MESSKGGIVVSVYNNKTNLFISGIHSATGQSVNGFVNIAWQYSRSCCRDTIRDSIEYGIESDTKTQYYYFNSLQEFARAVRDNGWE